MKYIKITIISVLLILTIIIAVLIYLYTNNNNSNNTVLQQNTENTENIEDTENTENEQNTIENNKDNENNVYNNENISNNEETNSLNTEKDYSIKNMTDRNLFFTIEDCITEYIEYQAKKDDYSVYSILTQDYIDENGITEENIEQKINFFDKKQIVRVVEMYVQNDEKDNNYKYYVHARIRENKNLKDDEIAVESDYYTTVFLNTEDKYYTINPDINYYNENMSNFKGGQ